MWWNDLIGDHHQPPSSLLDITRRKFVTGVIGGGLLHSQQRGGGRILNRPADVTLRIAPAKIEVAPRHTITTSTYNGTVPGPLIHLREGIAASVHIANLTDVPEYVHWHGFAISPELDGTEEEGS